MESKRTIYTLGHSIHTLEYFLEILQEYKINALVDVRSVPMSTFNPQFNALVLKEFLKSHQIKYLPFGEEFGARPTLPELFDESGQVDFKKVQTSKAFQRGLKRLEKGLNKGFCIALMSSKSDPRSCHRFALIGPVLAAMGYRVIHILPDKSSASQEELEEKLLKAYAQKLPQPNMFDPHVTREDQLVAAYRLKNNEIGFVQR